MSLMLTPKSGFVKKFLQNVYLSSLYAQSSSCQLRASASRSSKSTGLSPGAAAMWWRSMTVASSSMPILRSRAAPMAGWWR